MIPVLLCFISLIHCGFTDGPECCGKVTNSECKNACMQLSPTATQVEQISYLASVANFCPSNLIEFWQCAGQSLSVLEEMEIFSGRPCCNFTKSRLCREACIQAESEEDIETHCSRNTEDKLFDCIARQKDGEKCCQRASPNNPNCMSTCWHMYLSDSLALEHRKHLRETCKGGDRSVYQCVQKQTQSTQSNSLHCCEKVEDEDCKQECITAFKEHDSVNDIIDRVEKACGPVDLMNPLYQCFLMEEPPKSAVSAIDAAKLHCCEKATSNMCADMCVKTHNNQWSSIGRFEKNCGYMSSPVATMETLMHDCLKEVEEPCQLGCSGLSYCTNFNNRPTEHFRSCTVEADQAASNDILLWQKGTIQLPNLNIPVKDIRECEPEMWKSIACSLQIKPCHKTPTPLQICMEDCEYILSKCVDNTKLKSEGKVVKDLCNRLPPTDTGACISVRQYTTESEHVSTTHEVTHPCKSHNCEKDQICLVHRRKCKHSKYCPHFVCRKACPMGHASKLLVPQGTSVIIPDYHDADGRDQCQFYKICQCGHKGSGIGHCREMPQCVYEKHCMISTGNVKAHLQYYQSDCNDCVCFNGEQVCTKRTCPIQLLQNSQLVTGIESCDCNRAYQPVCGANGKTYPSACIARCVGQDEFQDGSCHLISACKNNPCQDGYLCVPHRKVCYGPRTSPCEQYECISLTEGCNRHDHDPVCDKNGEEFTNFCVLLAKGRYLDFRGHCPATDCSKLGIVCGHNGETYSSECAALADRTTVDYLGPCRVFGLITGATGENGQSVCEGIICPEVPSNCQGIIPPWSCCPVCAAELRTLSSGTLAKMVSSTVKKGPITVGDILTSLSSMVTVSECDVFGYLGLEGDLVILVAPVTQNPTSLQIQACLKEAERFEYLIKSRSPTITSNMLLTSILYAPLRTPKVTTTAGVIHNTPSRTLILTICILLLSHRILDFV